MSTPKENSGRVTTLFCRNGGGAARTLGIGTGQGSENDRRCHQDRGFLALGLSLAFASALLLGGCNEKPVNGKNVTASPLAASQLLDGSNGDDWPGPGRTFGEQHYSPLDQINDGNVGQLGLVSFHDLPLGTSVTQPIEVGGVLYMATGYSIVRAIDVVSGKELWSYDPKVPEAAGRKLRTGWGSRGIAWWDGKLYVGTQDGRLIAVDAKTGEPVWSVMTVNKDDGRYITGAPRVFDGKVIIGHGGADVDNVRGYVTTYDAQTGKQLWRFYIVPGNPANGFESKAMEMAAKTWSGQWWKYGGGGTAWNAFSYDPETDTVFVGTGNGAPWNYKIRSDGKGDNLFLCSIVALDAKTGAYKWHYQINPAESWDYNAVMDMEFADLTIDGKVRKVLITAPKNGFLYVIDRTDGKFISAEPYVKVTWAKGIDPETGRPIDAPNNRYETGNFTLAPTSVGAHSWLPMAFSPKAGLVYIPAMELESTLSDQGDPIKTWKRTPYRSFEGGVAQYGIKEQAGTTGGALVAWNPVAQMQAWRIPMPTYISGGVAATAGNIVFQGGIDSRFNAYDAKNGALLWSFDTQAPVMAPPISYSVDGTQYVTVLTGAGSSLVLPGLDLEKYGINYRDQKRRVLTFALGGKVILPKTPPYKFVPVADPEYRQDPAAEHRGLIVYSGTCIMCHGVNAIAAGIAPDLRASPAILDKNTFTAILHHGLLLKQGMPVFDDMSSQNLADIRQFLRSEAHKAVIRAAAK